MVPQSITPGVTALAFCYYIMLAKEEIAEFKQIYEDANGVVLTDEMATDLAHRLIGLYDALLLEYKNNCKNS